MISAIRTDQVAQFLRLPALRVHDRVHLRQLPAAAHELVLQVYLRLLLHAHLVLPTAM